MISYGKDLGGGEAQGVGVEEGLFVQCRGGLKPLKIISFICIGIVFCRRVSMGVNIALTLVQIHRNIFSSYLRRVDR